MSHIEHKSIASEKFKNLKIAVITVSDTRNEENDYSGKFIMKILKENNHEVVYYKILKDDYYEIKKEILKISTQEIDGIIINGGTGISKRDRTFDAVKSLIEKEIYGFGEIFRMLSYQEIGSAAIMSRACAGIINGKIIFSIPGSTEAVKLAMEKLIIPEISHILFEINR
ncbi:MAG: molybdenum cofactor biosynthesis protein B [Candidatus Altarchaeaceae archaeon]